MTQNSNVIRAEYVIKSAVFTKPKRLVVVLHGYGTNGLDFAEVGKLYLSRELDDTVFLFPDAPYQCDAGSGRQWFTLNRMTYEELREGLDDVGPKMHDFIQRASEEYGLNNRPLSKPSESGLLLGDTEHRSGVYSDVHEHSSTGSTQQETDYGGLVGKSGVFVMGFSQGAMLALEMGYYPGISGIVAYSGVFAKSATDRKYSTDTKVLIVHSDDDVVVPYQNAEAAQRRLFRMGVSVAVETCHNIGHTIDINGWKAAVKFVAAG
ncbi:MAG: dienelactone hydrolase family protein [Holosporales bacterium]|jgi:phospholipase/carboxylesterase|nr:dienelactone hydrolase family protein [Holosporales bacterium]